MTTSVHSRNFHSTSTGPLAESQTTRLRRFVPLVDDVRWNLVAEHGEIVARCTVLSRAGSLLGVGHSEDLATAVHEAADRVIRQGRRRKRIGHRDRKHPVVRR